MKTIVSLALAGLMSISALLPALAAQEAENVSIPESSGISESVAQDENTASGSGSLADGSAASDSSSTADESTEPESGSNAEDELLSRSPNPIACRWSLTAAFLRIRKLKPAVHCLFLKARCPTKRTLLGTARQRNSGIGRQCRRFIWCNGSNRGRTDGPCYGIGRIRVLLATNQADSMMGHAGMERSGACTQPAASFAAGGLRRRDRGRELLSALGSDERGI